MQFRLVERRERDARLGGREIVSVDERVDSGKGLALDHAAQEGFGRGPDLRRVDPDPPEEVPVRAQAGLVLQGLERVCATVVCHALLDEGRPSLVRGLDAQACHVEKQRLEAGKLRCQIRFRPQCHASGMASPRKRLRGLVALKTRSVLSDSSVRRDGTNRTPQS